jgi:hypothetical protein
VYKKYLADVATALCVNPNDCSVFKMLIFVLSLLCGYNDL